LKLLRRYKAEAMNKIAEHLENAALRHNRKIVYWHVDKLRGNSQIGFVPVKDMNETTVTDKERVN
jgi:hypothetical protein